MQRFGLRNSADCKCALKVKGVGAGLHNLGGMKRDIWGVLDVEEIFALQLPVLHPASCIYARCLNLNIQNGVFSVIRGESERGIPLVEKALDRHGCLHAELNRALDWSDLKNRNIRGRLCPRHRRK